MRGFTACLRCGSLELRGVKASEGAIGVAFFDLARCRTCGWQGQPIEFVDEASWRAFVAAQAGWRDAEGTETVLACRQCGERDPRPDGPQAQLSSCPHCGWRGVAASFASDEAWLAFARERKNVMGRGGEAG